jgi:hypothetical protein
MADENNEDDLSFENPDDFENFDEVDSATVELPEDSFDESAADFSSEDEH